MPEEEGQEEAAEEDQEDQEDQEDLQEDNPNCRQALKPRISCQQPRMSNQWDNSPLHTTETGYEPTSSSTRSKCTSACNEDVAGMNSPKRRIAIVLTLMEGQNVAGWKRDMGNWIDSLDPADNIPAIWDQFLYEFSQQFQDSQAQPRTHETPVPKNEKLRHRSVYLVDAWIVRLDHCKINAC
jgi:hypothetical protein